MSGAEHWSLAHSYLCDMDTVQAFKWPATDDMLPNASLHDKISLTSDRSGRNSFEIFHLFQACEYVQKHRKLPFDVTKDGIKRRSHTDCLVNILAIGQTLYLAIQSLLRGIACLEISLLELLTLTYIPLYLVIALIWFKKPKLKHPTVIIPFQTSENDRLPLQRFDGHVPRLLPDHHTDRYRQSQISATSFLRWNRTHMDYRCLAWRILL